MATKAHLEGNKRYLKTLDHITIRLASGQKDIIKAHAQTRNESVNAFINRAIDETMQRDAAAPGDD